MKFLSLFRLLAVLAALLLPAAAHAQAIVTGQAVTITISGVPQTEKVRVDGQYPVSQSGTVRLPFLGEIGAAGLTSAQLAARIEGAYRSAKIYNTPTIQVLSNTIQDIKQDLVTVGGFVRQPGPVKLQQGMTLYQAVQNAGGATEFGSMKRVRLMRNGKQREYNLDDPQQRMVLVERNDTIEVPQKGPFGG